MVIGDVFRTLRGEGYRINRQTIYRLIDNGHISEPERDGSNRYAFEEKHLDAIRRILNGRGAKRGCGCEKGSLCRHGVTP